MSRQVFNAAIYSAMEYYKVTPKTKLQSADFTPATPSHFHRTAMIKVHDIVWISYYMLISFSAYSPFDHIRILSPIIMTYTNVYFPPLHNKTCTHMT